MWVLTHLLEVLAYVAPAVVCLYSRPPVLLLTFTAVLWVTVGLYVVGDPWFETSRNVSVLTGAIVALRILLRAPHRD
jgi:VIT1/CCC1 family predicted Fe2+/Mn2+ transporter